MLNLGSWLSSENAIKGAFILGLPLFAFVGDGLVSWIVRDLVGSTFGFPREYRVDGGDPRYDRSNPWVHFRTGGIAGWSTARVFHLATDDGLAFHARSSFGFTMMRAVCVPWSALRLERASTRIYDRTLNLIVLKPDGSAAMTLDSAFNLASPADRRWLDSIGQRIAQPGEEGSGGESGFQASRGKPSV